MTDLPNLFANDVRTQVARDLAFMGLDAPTDSAQRNATVKVLDDIVVTFTAFDSFLSLLNAAGGYRPTIRCYDDRVHAPWERAALELLADAYDQTMERRGDERRAYRGSKPVKPAYHPEKLVAGEAVSYFRNQGEREGTVLAVLGDKALISYEMPSGVTYMNIVAADGSDEPGAYRTVSPKALPKTWKRAIDQQFPLAGRIVYGIRVGSKVETRELQLRD